MQLSVRRWHVSSLRTVVLWLCAKVQRRAEEESANHMKTTFKKIAILVSICTLTALGRAIAAGQATTTTYDDTEFKQGELSLSPFGTYVDKAGGKWGAGAALTYYVLQNVGIGASTYWTELKGTFFDNVEAEGYFRLPLFKSIAPYAVGGVGYQFDRRYWFETIGVGVDFRAFKRFDAFSDVQWRIANNSTKNGAFLRVGVRYTF